MMAPSVLRVPLRSRDMAELYLSSTKDRARHLRRESEDIMVVQRRGMKPTERPKAFHLEL